MGYYDVYRTPDTPSGDVVYDHYIVRVPRISEITRAIEGALVFLSYLTTWTQFGDMPAREVSWLIKEMINGARKVEFLIGMPIPVWTTPLADNLILADGRTVQRDDYPELWEVTPASMRTATTITVPDLRERFLIASGAGLVENTVGGSSTHTLSVNEMPSHTHTETYPSFNIDLEAPGVPDVLGAGNPPLPQPTGSAGGNQPHNNMPPYYVMTYAIIGRLTN